MGGWARVRERNNIKNHWKRAEGNEDNQNRLMETAARRTRKIVSFWAKKLLLRGVERERRKGLKKLQSQFNVECTFSSKKVSELTQKKNSSIHSTHHTHRLKRRRKKARKTHYKFIFVDTILSWSGSDSSSSSPSYYDQLHTEWGLAQESATRSLVLVRLSNSI